MNGEGRPNTYWTAIRGVKADLVTALYPVERLDRQRWCNPTPPLHSQDRPTEQDENPKVPSR